jgi:3-methyladenine DNA glycosylase AlkD
MPKLHNEGTSQEKARETRLRRRAYRLGYRLSKSRARILHSNNCGHWQVLDALSNTVVDGLNYDADTESLEAWFTRLEAA